MFNKTILVGNLTREIEMKFSASNLAIGHTDIATNRKFKNQMGVEKEEVMFMKITFFGRTAEIANQYLRKGSKVLVEGRLKLDQWTDQSGQKRSRHSLVVESMKMLDGKEDRGYREQIPTEQKKEVPPRQVAPVKDEVSFSETDIPF